MKTSHSRNILLADDSEFFREKLGDILLDAGHNLTAVEDGVEATEELEKNPTGFDLLILDLEMPRLDGFGVIDWIQAKGLDGKFPVLVVSGAYEPADAVNKIDGGAVTSVLSKESSPDDILFRVNKLLFPSISFERVADRAPCMIATDFGEEGSFETGIIINISSTGLFLKTTKNLEEGTILKFRFNLPGVDKKIEATGILKWATTVSGKDNRFGGLGVMFTQIRAEDAAYIQNYAIEEIKKFGTAE
ncbi:MAG: response regulator [Deltaproteobacteria bacterium]|nr:response regulator [Deltaproteobacteria bacterium]